MPAEGDVLQALATVRDPELDESIVALGFVSAVEVEDSCVRVRLRLPTYFCAPNFAWLMVADAKQALASVPGVTDVEVRLEDHFAAGEINRGVDESRDFASAFAGLADGGLEELRLVFRRKALLARQDRLVGRMLASGWSRGRLGDLRIGDLPAGPDTDAYLQRRAELDMATDPDALLLVDDHGTAVGSEAVETQLRRARLVAVSLEGNAGMCRGLLATRYAQHKESDA